MTHSGDSSLNLEQYPVWWRLKSQWNGLCRWDRHLGLRLVTQGQDLCSRDPREWMNERLVDETERPSKWLGSQVRTDGQRIIERLGGLFLQKLPWRGLSRIGCLWWGRNVTCVEHNYLWTIQKTCITSKKAGRKWHNRMNTHIRDKSEFYLNYFCVKEQKSL